MCKYMNNSRINIHPLLSKIKSISSSSRDLQVPLNQHLRTALNYWKDLNNYKPIPILSQNPLYSIYVDASSQGWGATVHKDQMTQSWSGKWDAQVKSQHINLKELNGVLQILKILPLEIQNCHINMFNDNSSTISWLRKQGSHKIKSVNNIILQINTVFSKRNLSAEFFHIKGIHNSSADLHSRTNHSIPGELNLSDKLFAKICSKFAIIPEVDLFASPSSKSLQNFISSIPCKEASGLNAFTIDWELFKNLNAFPLVDLIAKVVFK